MKLSVVINTYNRAATLRNTLDGLRYQTVPDFEVVVVNGPSTDGSDELLQQYGEAIRVYRCPEVHLSRSRNIGVTHAAGDVVAFIDDDAVPDPRWVEELIAGYDHPTIGGVGGLVYDHTGAKFQYQYSACSRIATPVFSITPPFDDFNRPGADPFLYLQGTNCSFRRDMLTEIGGFNDEIEYHLDEVEICLLGIDAGYTLQALNGARVYHKYARSHIRTAKRVILDPYTTVKNHCTFAVRYGRVNRPLTDVLAAVSEYLVTVKQGGYWNRDQGAMTDDQLVHYLERTERAAEVGIRQGLTQPRPFTRIPPARAQEFRSFPTHAPIGGRLKTVFVSQEFPPQQGGIGRWTADLATEYARLGHEVRVITHGESHTVDFQDGIWLHRIPVGKVPVPVLDTFPIASHYSHAAAVHREIERIHESVGVDLVSAPIWACEGAISRYDSRWPTVLSLHTTYQTLTEMGGTPNSQLTRELLALERETAHDAPYLYANSRAVLEKTMQDANGLTGTAYIVPHGSEDVRDEYPPTPRFSLTVRMLFVGRIETRKGIDVLLEAAYAVLADCPNAELHLIGRQNPVPDQAESILERHYRTVVDRPDIDSRIRFLGMLPDEELRQAYADCDVFVLPSKYESFGLVLTEAMLFSKPVIGVRAGGPAEIIADGKNGFLVPPDDPAALAQAMRTLIESPDLRARFGQCSRELYEAKFTVNVMAVRTIACHRAVIQSWKSNPLTTPTLRESVASLIRRVTGLDTTRAKMATQELLPKPWARLSPQEYLARTQQLAGVPNAEFIQGIYGLLLSRRPTPEEFENWRIHLENGLTRRTLLEEFAFSPEAVQLGLPTEWIEAVHLPTQSAWVPRAGLRSPQARIRDAIRRAVLWLSRLPGVGKCIRAMIYCAQTPRRIRNLEERTAALQEFISQQLGTIRHTVKAQTAAVETLARQTAIRDRRMQWALHTQASHTDQSVRHPPDRMIGNRSVG